MEHYVAALQVLPFSILDGFLTILSLLKMHKKVLLSFPRLKEALISL